MSQFKLLGNPNIPNRDIYARISGQRRYASDIQASDIGASSMVYMGLVTSPYPSAKITKIDVSKAEAAGYATLTGNDLQTYNYYNSPRSYTPLVADSVMFAGQGVVAVAAPSPNQVQDAINLVNVEYEPTPYVMDIEEALKSTSPQIWPGGNSLLPTPQHTEYGDINAGFSQATQVVEQKFEAGFHQHLDLEPVNVTAYWSNGTLYAWIKSSYAFGDQSTLANYFGLPLSDVVCKVSLGGTTNSSNGGMFGNSTAGDFEIITAAMARKVGTAVQFVPTRANNHLASTARFPVRYYLKLGANSSGKLTALQATAYMDFGSRGTAFIDGVDDLYSGYIIPNVSIDTYAGNTNQYGMGAPMRDVGESQAHFALETAIDMLAQKLGTDPVTFRLNNLRTSPGAVDPTTNAPFAELAEPETFNQGVSAFNWSAKWKGWTTPSSVNGAKRRGIGVAYMSDNKGSMFPPSSAQIQINPDGSVIHYCGHSDQGAGTTTAIPLIGAEALGLTSLDNYTYISGDTSQNTDSSVTAGSEGTRNGGTGTLVAIAELKKQWFPIVAKKLGVTDPTTLAFGNNTIYDTSNPSNSIAFKDAAALLSAPLKVFGNGTPAVLAAFATTHRVTGPKFVEVEVDIETADVKVVSGLSAMEIGQIIWYKGAYAQAHGGFVGQGLGQALFEGTINDPSTGLPWSGSYLNPNYSDTKPPTIMETPDTHDVVLVEGNDPTGPFGAKGMGEPSLTATSAAIANALSNALGGYRFYKLPIRKEDIVAAIQTQQSAGKI